MPCLRASIVCTAYLAALAFAITASAQCPVDFRPQLAVLHSENPGSALPRQRTLLALWYVAEEMGVPEKDLPPMVVIRARPDTAKVAVRPAMRKGIQFGDSGAVVAYERPDTKERVYELWITGDNPEFWLTVGMVKILAVQRGLDFNREEDHVRRVTARLSATISADALVSKPSAR